MIQIKDQALSPSKHDDIYKLVSNKAYRRQEKDTPDQPDNEMTYTYEFQDTEKDFLVRNIYQLFNFNEEPLAKYSNVEYKPTRVYANAFHFGDTPRFHTDSEDPNALTILYYPNREWQPSWGGETLIVYENQTVEQGVYLGIAPVPNRAIIFNGNLEHTAKAPTRQGLVRYSIAIKLEATKYLNKPRMKF